MVPLYFGTVNLPRLKRWDVAFKGAVEEGDVELTHKLMVIAW